jgi:hypothetical protein
MPPKRRKRKTNEELAAFREAIRGIVMRDPPMTVRHTFYLASVAGLVEKTEAGYDAVGKALLWLRRNGRLPWSHIRDGTRQRDKAKTFSSVEQAVEETARLYRRSLWRDQAAHVEIWCEKDTLTGVLWPVVSEWDVPLMVSRGFTSDSYLHEAAEDLSEVGKPAHLYYVSDYDPSGVLIDRTIERKLRAFAPAAEIHFERIAVTPHVRRHGPCGYADYTAYKPWLRDEFSCRCVYCLFRERWHPSGEAGFSADHVEPQSRAPHRICDYTNLLYACLICNSTRQNRAAPDPCAVAFGAMLWVREDGTAEGLTSEGSALIQTLGLNRKGLREYRVRMQELLRACERTATSYTRKGRGINRRRGGSAMSERPAPRSRVVDRQQVIPAMPLENLLDSDHQARLVWDFCSRLDLAPLCDAVRSREGGPGHPAIDPGFGGDTRRERDYDRQRRGADHAGVGPDRRALRRAAQGGAG